MAGAQADPEFHGLIAEACGSPALKEKLRLLLATMQVIRQVDTGPGRTGQSLLDYWEILKVLRERDGGRAMEIHDSMGRGKHHLLEIVREA